MKILLFLLTLSFTLSTQAQDIQSLYRMLPDVVTDLTKVEKGELLEAKAFTRVVDEDTLVYTIDDETDEFISISQVYKGTESAFFTYQIRKYKLTQEDRWIIAFSRQTGDDEGRWQIDFQLFEYTEDDGVFGLLPLERQTMLRNTASATEEAMLNPELSIYVDLTPNPDYPNHGFDFVVVNNAESQVPVEEIPVKWNGYFFTAR